MKCVHSLWTGTPGFLPRRGPMLIHALSACYAARYFVSTELVTDHRGLALVEALGIEYTSVTTALEGGVAEPGILHMWALGKLAAILTQHSPFLHTDTDVLFTLPPEPRITRSRVVAQSRDYPEHYLGENMVHAQGVAGLPGNQPAYNCGVIGGTDLLFLHEYARRTLSLAGKFSGRDVCGTVGSMVVEQYHVGHLAREMGVRVETVLPMHPTAEQFAATGYIHLQGAAKHNPVWIAKAEKRLSEQFPEAYARFIAGWAVVEAGRDGWPQGGSSTR